MKRVFSVLALLLFVSALYACGQRSSKNNDPVEPDERIISLNSDDFEHALYADDSDELVILLDVRTPQEYAQGHLKGAINIDVKEKKFVDNVIETLKIKEGRNLPTIAVYCRSGVRSVKAANLLLEKKCAQKVYNLEKGILEWRGEIVQ